MLFRSIRRIPDEIISVELCSSLHDSYGKPEIYYGMVPAQGTEYEPVGQDMGSGLSPGLGCNDSILPHPSFT